MATSGGLAIPRVAFDADLFRIHILVGFKIVKAAARTPCPRLQSTPIIELARLALVGQADDSLRQARAIVGLHTGRDVFGIAPAPRQHLLLPCRPRPAIAANCGNRLASIAMNSLLKPSSMMTGTGPLASAGVVSVRSMFTVISGSAELSTCPTSVFVITGTSPFFSCTVLTTSQLTLGRFAGMRP